MLRKAVFQATLLVAAACAGCGPRPMPITPTGKTYVERLEHALAARDQAQIDAILSEVDVAWARKEIAEGEYRLMLWARDQAGRGQTEAARVMLEKSRNLQ